VGLEGELEKMEAKVRDRELRYETLTEEKSSQLAQINVERQDAAERHQLILGEKNSKLLDLKTKSQEALSKWQALVEEKNTQIIGLGEQLQQISAKLSELLKKNQIFESQNLGLRNKIDLLEERLGRLDDQKMHLAQIVKSTQMRDSID